MNNLTKNKTVRCLAFISTVAVYYFGTSLIIAILIQVIHARITHPASHSTLFYVATLVEWLTLLILIIIAAFRNGYHWKSYRNIDLAEHRALVKKKQLATKAITETKNAYAISDVTGSGRALTLMITFYQNLYRNALPMVKVNGNLVTIHATGRCKVRCFIGNFVSSEEDFLKIEVGKDSVRTVENPYYMTNCPTLPNWQCKGNIGDRRIVIPKEYFPNANENVVYPFSFYVENRRIAELFGNFIPAEHAIVILIGSRKDMHSSECSGKRCMLRVKYGRGRCILLAEPSILANPMLA